MKRKREGGKHHFERLECDKAKKEGHGRDLHGAEVIEPRERHGPDGERSVIMFGCNGDHD